MKGSVLNRPSSSVCGVVTLNAPSVHHLLATLSHFGGVYIIYMYIYERQKEGWS